MSFKFKWCTNTQNEIENAFWFCSRCLEETNSLYKSYQKFLNRTFDPEMEEIELNHMERSIILNALIQYLNIVLMKDNENPSQIAVFRKSNKPIIIEDGEEYDLEPELEKVGECSEYMLLDYICSMHF